MRCRDMRQSGNMEDRRGMGGGGGLGGFNFGGGGFRPSGMGGLGGLGIGGILILVVVSWLMGVNPMSLLDPGSAQQLPAETGKTGAPSDDPGQFAAAVLGDTEDFWTAYFRNAG